MSEHDERAAKIPGLSEQIEFFCRRVGITVSALESRLQLPHGALKQHLADDDGAPEPGLAGVLRISFPECDWVPGSPTFPGMQWRPRLDPMGALADEPRTDTQRRLLKIWRRVLKNDRIGIDDDFVLSGGSSLQAARVLSRIFDVFDVRIPPEIVAKANTVAKLAEIVERSQEAEQTLILWSPDDGPEIPGPETPDS